MVVAGALSTLNTSPWPSWPVRTTKIGVMYCMCATLFTTCFINIFWFEMMVLQMEICMPAQSVTSKGMNPSFTKALDRAQP